MSDVDGQFDNRMKDYIIRSTDLSLKRLGEICGWVRFFGVMATLTLIGSIIGLVVIASAVAGMS